MKIYQELHQPDYPEFLAKMLKENMAELCYLDKIFYYPNAELSEVSMSIDVESLREAFTKTWIILKVCYVSFIHYYSKENRFAVAVSDKTITANSIKDLLTLIGLELLTVTTTDIN